MTRQECLTRAEKCVCGGRDIDHGKPEDTFGTIGKFWSDYLGVPVDAHDVCVMMVLFKAARVRCGGFVEDNYVDMAGYAACAGEAKQTSDEVESIKTAYTSVGKNKQAVCNW